MDTNLILAASWNTSSDFDLVLFQVERETPDRVYGSVVSQNHYCSMIYGGKAGVYIEKKYIIHLNATAEMYELALVFLSEQSIRMKALERQLYEARGNRRIELHHFLMTHCDDAE